MISDVLGNIFSLDQGSVVESARPYYSYAIYLFVVSLIFAWRLWTFTLRPLLHPDELEYFPYWIPFLGHTISFLKNTNSIYTQARKQFYRRPYKLYVGGKDIAVFTDPSQVLQIFKDSNSYSFDPFIDMVYDGVGNVSREAKITLWRTPAEGFESLHPNPKQKVLVHTGNELLHKQILQPANMQELLKKVLVYINDDTQWDNFHKTTVLASNANEKVVSLHCWCRDVLIEAQNRTWFGDYIQKLEPDMRLIFDQWDYNSWRITYQVPSFFAKRATRPRDRIIQVLIKYFYTPREIRAGGVPFVNELQDECMHAGLGNEDIAGILMIIMWGINSNVQMTSFWMVAHLLKRPEVVTEIREEIAAAMKAVDSTPDIDGATLADITKREIINSCPLLNSTFNEVLRVCSTGSSVREVMKPMQIDGKNIPKGIKIVLPQRSLLLDSRVFGANADEFDHYRFLRDKSLERNEHFRPFGGGVTLCSGRTVGRFESLSFVAFIFWKYDMEIVGPKEKALGVKGMRFPRLDIAKPSNGMSKQVEEDDLILKISRRALK